MAKAVKVEKESFDAALKKIIASVPIPLSKIVQGKKATQKAR